MFDDFTTTVFVMRNHGEWVQRYVETRILGWRDGNARRRMAAFRICRFLRDAICNLQSSTCCLWQVAGRGALGHGDVVGLP